MRALMPTETVARKPHQDNRLGQANNGVHWAPGRHEKTATGDRALAA